jgi:hypothetical protein
MTKRIPSSNYHAQDLLQTREVNLTKKSPHPIEDEGRDCEGNRNGGTFKCLINGSFRIFSAGAWYDFTGRRR